LAYGAALSHVKAFKTLVLWGVGTWNDELTGITLLLVENRLLYELFYFLELFDESSKFYMTECIL